MSKIYLDWNLGLGDAIICNSIVRELSKVHELIILPIHHHNINTLNAMFSDLNNIIFSKPLDWLDLDTINLSIGCNNPRFKDFPSFDVAFYELAGIPFENRWSSFHAPLKNPMYTVHKDYILKHDDTKRGFEIQPRHLNATYPIINFEGCEAVTDYIPLIENAMEIHCIDSSMIHLVDSVNPKPECQLFYHKYARNNGLFHQSVKRHRWTVLE